MARAIRAAGVALGLMLCGSAAAAAQGTDACATFKWPIAAVKSAMSAAGLPTVASGQSYPALGQAVVLTLAPEAGVAYTVRPTRPPKVDPAYGAELALASAGAGTVEVTLSDDVWVDLVQGGRILKPTAFSGRTGCDGVRKSVRFTVSLGPVAIAISNARAPTVRLDVTRVQ